jgi:hypothetical protein
MTNGWAKTCIPQQCLCCLSCMAITAKTNDSLIHISFLCVSVLIRSFISLFTQLHLLRSVTSNYVQTILSRGFKFRSRREIFWANATVSLLYKMFIMSMIIMHGILLLQCLWYMHGILPVKLDSLFLAHDSYDQLTSWQCDSQAIWSFEEDCTKQLHCRDLMTQIL